MNKLPLARNNDILVQPSGNELLIYDLTTNKAYHLNQTSVIVYQACDGKTTFAVLKRKHKFTDDIIHLTLDELKKNNLLADEYTSPFVGMNRREIIRKVGLASMITLPVIVGLVAPRAAAAQSGLSANGADCTANSQCKSNVCTGSKCCTNTVGTGNTVCSSIDDCCFGGNGLVFCSTNSSGVANRCCFGRNASCSSTSQCCTGLTCSSSSHRCS